MSGRARWNRKELEPFTLPPGGPAIQHQAKLFLR